MVYTATNRKCRCLFKKASLLLKANKNDAKSNDFIRCKFAPPKHKYAYD